MILKDIILLIQRIQKRRATIRNLRLKLCSWFSEELFQIKVDDRKLQEEKKNIASLSKLKPLEKSVIHFQ